MKFVRLFALVFLHLGFLVPVAFSSVKGSRVEIEVSGPLEEKRLVRGTVLEEMMEEKGEGGFIIGLDDSGVKVTRHKEEIRSLFWEELNESKEIAPEARDYLTLEEARDLINEFKKSAELGYTYPLDGCYWRAHLMAYELNQKGKTTEKVWINEPLTDPLLNDKGTDGGFAFHVAPVIWVEEEKGHRVKRVIDPAYSDNPLSFEDWASKMDAGPKTHHFVPKVIGKGKKNQIFFFESKSVFPVGNDQYTYDETLELARKDLQRIAKLPSVDLNRGFH